MELSDELLKEMKFKARGLHLQASVLVAEAMVLLFRAEALDGGLPKRAKELLANLRKHIDDRTAKAIVEANEIPEELRKKRYQLDMQWIKKTHTLERHYNKVCDRWPNETYADIHSYLRAREGKFFSKTTLRQYKKRRIEKTNDFRESPSITKIEVRRVRDRLREAPNCSLSKSELIARTGLNDTAIDMILKKLSLQRKIAYPKGKHIITYID